jgi:hypothetical protein
VINQSNELEAARQDSWQETGTSPFTVPRIALGWDG